jgi:chromosome segregation ATPase
MALVCSVCTGKRADVVQTVQQRRAVLEAAFSDAQAAVGEARDRVERLAQVAAAQSSVLTAEDLESATSLRGRLAELTAAKALASTALSQRSEIEGGGKHARFGNPKHAQTAAVKKALSLQEAGLLGPLAHLGSVQDTTLSELLSAHLGCTLRTLVVDTPETRYVPVAQVDSNMCFLHEDCLQADGYNDAGAV